MWASFRASKIAKDGRELITSSGNFNVNEEYFSALRTKSFADFFTKAQLLVNMPSSPSHCYNTISKILLEPEQETIATILESAIFSKKPNLKDLILKFFDMSAEASRICSHLLTNINEIQSNYRFIQRAVNIIGDYSPEQFKYVMSELTSFNLLNNPFSNPNDQHEFKLIHDQYSSVLHRLKSKRKKVARKIKLIKCFKKATGICITAACGLVAVTTIVLAAHTLTGLLMGPAIFSFPPTRLKNKFLNFRFLRSGFLRKIGEQLDVAAKGTYILNRDFDTMSLLVARLHDEIEHSKEMIQFCLERREDRFPLQEVVKELRRSDIGFKKQVEELEEHVYLCLVTINRARVLVIKEMTTSCEESVS
ncbi:hypothetical protein HHK36_004178 [Tetracentron sinense]|uniref:Uncharacterized protein n=1 Tax=Tetracentron sinense TaxID=13715 RepID=A0A834ZZD4_TETSI|nr:hypothetical protein HHK36_004178 [Tetracentron sinense]